MSKTKENKKHRSVAKKIIIAILILIILACFVVLAVYYFGTYKVERAYKDMLIGAQTTIEENPIDFDYLTDQNDEVYAWIKIDDTNIDYPISQSKVDDEFYLKHSSADKSYTSSGAIYTEVCNATDFSDPITVIYGHNGYSTTMFTTLHYFEDKEFFDSHEYFVIYLNGRKLTYQVISAFTYDNRHIMNNFDFDDLGVLLSFQEMLQDPESDNKNVREDLDVEINKDSNIVILSTCITNRRQNRYLVSAVLVKDEVTA